MKWIAVFAFLLGLSCTASVFAETAPEGPIQVTLPSPSDSAELAQLPDNTDMAETLAQIQAEDEEIQGQLESPAAVQEREESGEIYAGLGAAQAEELLTTQFASVLEALDDEPARYLSETQLIRRLGEGGALVLDEGRKKLIEGTAPVLAPEGGGKIDLSLESTGTGYQPENPIVEIHIPDTAEEGVAIGEEGLEISQAGAEGEPEGRLVEGLNVFYPEVHTDTDLLVSPTATGVELFDQLRSENSPDELRFHLQMPEGAQLQSSGNGAVVIAADGSKLASVPPPLAVDAQGTEVPVQMQVEGNSLILDVHREPGEFAYPILVDPIIEEWYYANWYQGYNLQALAPGGPWHWNTSEGPSSSYVYGSTSCIYTCWGSHRGLYMSTPNGTIPANKWGQWSYSAPNLETYLGNAWVSPFWRDDHVNCPSSVYSQPYDYVGMWNETSWNRILYNESTKNNNQGWADIQSWGRAFIIGMGVSSQISPTCWRDIMAGGTRMWLEDWSRPYLTTSSSGTWMDASPIRLNVSAYDSGLGVQKFKATATTTSGATGEWETKHSCTGLSQAPCPHTWNLGEASQPLLSFDPSVLPEGIDKLSVTAYDAAEKPSFSTNEMTVRIDHAAPAITFTGTLTEQPTLGTELPLYKVLVVALDGDPTATQSEPSKSRSGVVYIETELDGKLIEKFTPECSGEPNCGAEEEIGFQAAGLSPGQHTFTARARDAFGHPTTKELKFTISADKTAPKIGANSLPGASSYAEQFGSFGTGNGQLKSPADVAIDSKGNVWALDKGNNRIEQFNEKGEFVKTVGSSGTSGGKLSAPAGLAIDPSGNLWVADTANNRIEQFNEKGEFVLVFGKEVNKTKVEAGGTEAEKNLCTAASGNVCKAGVAGSGNGQLSAPRGIAATSGGNLWVADTGNNRIQKFGSTGNFLNVVTGEGSSAGKMKEPSSIAMGPDGSIWVADSGSNRIEQWTSALALQRVFGGEGTTDGQFQQLGAIDVDAQGNVWAADITSNNVQGFNEVGTFIGKFGVAGNGPGQFNFSSPIGVAADSKGNIWVTDANNNRIQKWQRPAAPSYTSSFGSSGSGNGQFAHPAGIAVDAEGNIFVVDQNNKRVEKFNDAGQYVSSFGSPGTGNGQFGRPTDLAIDANGNLWVTDAGNHRIQQFNENGQYLRQFGSEGTANGQFKGPECIAIDPKGNIWIGDTYNGRLQKFNGNGEFIKIAGSKGTGPGQLIEPTGIAIGPSGNVWVADWGNQRVAEFNENGDFLRQFGSAGTANGQFKRPDVIEVDGAGNIWVGDEGNSRLQRFNERGEFIAKLGSPGTGPGQFSFGWPMGMAIDKDGNLLVSDTGNNRVQRWAVPALHIGSALWPLTASATDKGGYGVTSLKVNLTSGDDQTETLDSATQSCPDGSCSMSEVFETLDLAERPAGPYSLQVEATDGAGNSSRSASNFILDPGPPELTLSGPLAEGAGQPMTAAAGELAINASETDTPTSGIRKISVEVDDQRVASSTFNCATDCQEVTSSYRYNAAREGANRSIEAAATPSGALSKSLSSVSCLSASDCTAVGYYNKITNRTLVEHWDGNAWQVVSSPNPSGAIDSRLESISCVSASSCVAVGYYQSSTGPSTLIESWNGTAWSIVSSPNATGFARNYLYGVSCVSASDCWAVGKSAYTSAEEEAGKSPKALLERWNGSEWTIVTAGLLPSQLKSVSCFSATFCMAVSGQSGSWAERWNGTSWSWVFPSTPSGGSGVALSGVACTAENSCTAVGSYTINGRTAPLAERWNGTGWTAQKTPDPSSAIEEVTSGSLSAISCWGADACTAVGTRSAGSESAPLIEGWDGTDWALQPTPVPSGASTAMLNGVTCIGAFNCYAVGTKAGTNALIEREVPDAGSKTVTVEATDRYGNSTTKSINVDIPEFTSQTPTCNQEATSVTPKAVVTATEAATSLQESVPAAVEQSVGTTNEANGEEVDPTYSQPNPNLASLGTPTEGETEVTPDGGFTIEGVACFSPATVTTAATEAKVVNGDAAIFANTAPETDTLLRPNAAGMTMVQSLRGASAPTTLSWNVTLNPDENLVELPSGAVAITRDGTEATGETPEVSAPEGMRSEAVLKDAELQLETIQYQLIEAESETTEEVIAVIPQPWIILSQGSIMPLKIEVEQDVEVPTEYTMTYEYPPFEINFTPVGVVTEVGEAGGATASASSISCPNGSPCGQFVVSEAVKYAKHWGKPERNNKYPDFGSNNCTNFLSQIMAHGGMAYMRAFEHGDGSWWVKKFIREPGVTFYDYTESWSLADVLPRHLWRYGLIRIDTSNQPSGWQTGDMLAEDWYGTNGKGDFNHVQFVSGTRTGPGGSREPLIANSSSPAHLNYSEDPWIRVKKRIEEAHPEGWNRVPLVPKHRYAIWNEKGAKKHDPANLYNAGGVFQE
ncbi:MAG TPA: SMP-30/gluconolactonase/LRE family protein [Solirubrobacterales bacterium]|nr:SMP-30/gluconolactonase/LRE family protein [Solirubrobacterales bacterium]